MKSIKQQFTLLSSIFIISFLVVSLTNTGSQAIIVSDMSWNEISPANTPPGRDSNLLVYDPVADRVIMFGGWSDTSAVSYINNTWIFNPSTQDWTNVTSMVSPGARGYIQGVYDSATNEVIFFGGINDTTTFGDIWGFSYTGYTWRNISTPVSPTPRAYYGVDYSTRNNTLVMFGGSASIFSGSDIFNETWAYTSTAGWTNLTTSNQPEGRVASSLVYDEINDKFILFGGSNSSGLLNDTWIYDLNTNTWAEMFPVSVPSARADQTMFYDRYHGQVILFGGYNDTNSLNDTWVYDYPANSWIYANTTIAPSERSYLRSTYISSSNEYLLFGGYSEAGNSLNDTWVFKWAGGTPPVSSTSTTTTSTINTTTNTSSTSMTTTPTSESTTTTPTSESTTTETSSTTSSPTSSTSASLPLPTLRFSAIFTGLGMIVLLRKYKK
ncbi:MAG: kelch repeat-containing protein [Candidatus Heimdallarchaeota archaeon]